MIPANNSDYEGAAFVKKLKKEKLIEKSMKWTFVIPCVVWVHYKYLADLANNDELSPN